MIWEEMKFNIHSVYLLLLEALKARYNYRNDPDGIQFRNTKGRPFNIFVMGNAEPWKCVVVEYEDTGEDGGLYYPEDFDSYEAMLQAMLKEIEG